MTGDVFEEITVLYGSQTGTAEDIARHLHRQLYQVLPGPVLLHLFSCDEFLTNEEHDEEDWKPLNRLLIFVCSTTGSGDPPDNMRFFWRAVMSRQFDPVKVFGQGSLRCAVLGLGDSSYERFNFVAKKLERRFEQVLGSEPFIELGLADDQDQCGLYSAVDPWITALFDKLKLPVPSKDLLPTFRFNIDPHSTGNNEGPIINETGKDSNKVEALLDLPCDSTRATLALKERLTSADHFQDVRLVKLKTNDLVYYPGDVCFIQPANITELVTEFVELLGIDVDETVKISTNNNKKVVVVSVGSLVKQYFNLCYVPSRSFFDLLSRFSTVAMEKERLQELANNYDDLLDYVLRPKRNVVEVFRDFREITQALRELPISQRLSWLFEVIPPIRARAFSIASAQVEVGPEIHLLIAIVKYQTKIRKQRLGLCTNWLLETPVGSEVTIWIRPSSMRFPIMRPAPSMEPFPPIIMVGPGTGLAPFRAYVQYRAKLATVYGSDILAASNDNMWLFFGCRFSKHDFLFKDDLLNWQTDERLRLELAFSRDSSEKVYVQHRIAKNNPDIGTWILRRGAHVCIAGNALQMPTNVKTTLRDALIGEGLLGSSSEADAYIDEMQKKGRLVIEAWS